MPMRSPRFFLLLMLSLINPAIAAGDAPQIGDCAIFREGGAGRIFRTPIYWLQGTIAGISAERRMTQRCPQLGKPASAYTREDWVRIAASTPCVHSEDEMREVDVVRIRFEVDAWETPWSLQHGSTGWLFRGYFLDQPLKKGGILDLDANWLERCVPRPG